MPDRRRKRKKPTPPQHSASRGDAAADASANPVPTPRRQRATATEKSIAIYRNTTLQLIDEHETLSKVQQIPDGLYLYLLLRIPLTVFFVLLLRVNLQRRAYLNENPLDYKHMCSMEIITFFVTCSYMRHVQKIHLDQPLLEIRKMPLTTIDKIDAARVRLMRNVHEITGRYRQFGYFLRSMIVISLFFAAILGTRIFGDRIGVLFLPLFFLGLAKLFMWAVDNKRSKLIWSAEPQTGLTQIISDTLAALPSPTRVDWQTLAMDTPHPLWLLMLPKRTRTVKITIDSQEHTLLFQDFLIAIRLFATAELHLATKFYPSGIALKLTPAAFEIQSKITDASSFAELIKQTAGFYQKFLAKLKQLNSLVHELRLAAHWQYFIPTAAAYTSEDTVQFTLYIANEALREALLQAFQAVYGETSVTSYGPQLRITGLAEGEAEKFELPKIESTSTRTAGASADKAEADDSDSDDDDSSDDDVDDYEFSAKPATKHWSATTFSFLRNRSEPASGSAAAAASTAGERIPKWNNPRYNDLAQGYPKRFKAIDRGNGAIHWVYFDEKRLTRKLGDANLLGEFSELFSTATFSTHNLGEVGHKMHWSINKAVLKKGGRGNNEIEGPQVAIDTEGHALYSLNRLGKHGR